MTIPKFLRLDFRQALRAVAFGIAWIYFPWWLFLLVALYCYLRPLFQAGKFALPFGILLLICLVTPFSWLMAVILAALFYYLLLIKDLLIIDRVTARALLAMALSFFLFREFYAANFHGSLGFALIAAFLVAGISGWLIYDLIANAESESRGGAQVRMIAGWISFLVMAESLIAGLFLPIDFVYQSVIVFLIAVVFISVMPEYFKGRLSFAKIRMTCITLLILFVITLSAARWGI